MALRCSGYNQAVFLTWFHEPDGWLEARVRAHKEIRDAVMEVIRDVPGVSAKPTEGGSYLFVTIPELDVSIHQFIRIVRELADVAVITSDNPRTEEPWAIIRDILAGMGGPGGEVHVEPDRKQAIRWALAQGRPGDVIVLAGKGHETVQEVQGVSLPLDEREVVAEYFEKRAQYRERAGNLPAGVV